MPQNKKPTEPTAPNAPQATSPTQPAPVAAPGAVQPAAPAVDIAAAVAAAKADENERVLAIGALCDKHGVSGEVRATLVNDCDVTVAQAKGVILDSLAATQKTVQSGIVVTGDAGDRRYQGVSRALMIRANLLTGAEAAKEQGNEYVHCSLMELAKRFDEPGNGSRASLDVAARVLNAGNNMVGRFRADIGITHSTSDFPLILQNIANKSMLKGWEQTPQTWRPWTNVGNLTDFKAASRVSTNFMSALPAIPEGAEYQSLTMTERGVTIQLGTYGAMFGITRQSLMNDDLQAFTAVPQKFGASAARTIADTVYGQLTSNPTFDGTALFDGSRNNTHAVGDPPISDDLGTLRAAMRTQEDPDHGVALNIMPRYLLLPAAYEQAGRELINNSLVPDGAGAAIDNPWRGSLEQIIEPRLDTASATTIYMAGDGAIYDTIEVAFLNGQQLPFLDRMPGWRIDGLEHKVRIDFAVAIRDFRALQRGT